MSERGAVGAIGVSATRELARPAVALRVLLVEDSEADALLLLRELRRGGYDTTWWRVGTAKALAEALREPWDLITCDWKMPAFSAPEALALIGAAAADVPVIIVSGEVGEEFAVTAMRAGARDFVGKQRLARLVPAVDRELREAEARRARRRAEEALRAAQERYRALIENASDQVAVVDANGIYQYLSPSHVDLCGFTPEELLGTSAFDLVHPDDQSVLADRLTRGLQERPSFGVAEFRIRHKDGSWRVIETVVQNLLDDPLVHGILINGRDVTRRRRMEDTLRLQAAIIANLAEGVALIRVSDDTIVHANPKFEEMFGYGPLEMIGQPASILAAPEPESAGQSADDIGRALRTSGAWSGESRCRRRDGMEFWTRVSISTFAHPEHGEVRITIRSDISEQKRVDAALRRSEEHMRLAMGAAPMGTWEWDLVSDAIHWSDTVWEMFGLDRSGSEPTFARFVAAVHPDDRDLIVQKAEAAVAGDILDPIEMRIVRPDGSVRWLLAHHRVVRDGAGKAVRLVGINLDITERRRVDEQANRWRTVFDAAQFDVAYSNTSDDTLAGVNTAFARRRGYRPDELVGRPLFDLFPPEEQSALRQRWSAIDRLGHLIFETVHLRKDGTRFPVLMDITAIRDDAGAVVSRVAFALDLSELRHAEEQARISDRRYRSLFQNMLEGYALCRLIREDGVARDFVYLDVNDAFEKLTGLRDVVGKRVSEVIPGFLDDHADLLDAYARVVATGQGERFESYIPRLGNWFAVSAYAAGEDDFVAVFDNITDAKESHVRTAVQTTALRAAANAIVITDRDGSIVWANPAFTGLTGYELHEVLGQNLRLLKSGVQDDGFYTRIWQTIAAGRVWAGQLVNRRKNGTRYTEEMTITPVRSDDGAITHFIAVKQDVTARQHAEEEIRRLNSELERRVADRTAELEAANRELEAFSYSVSHDLRAPLRSVDGFSQALLDDYAAQLPDEARHYLETIRAAAQRMGHLIAAMLNLSRLGRQALVRRPLDTGLLVREVLDELRPLAAGREVDLHIGELPPSQADPTLLRQVWLNLLGNAFKYTAGRDVARIEIGSVRRAGEVVYFVRDNGAGFDMRYADRLFGVFQRLHSQAQFEGTGVGLAIVQRIVHRHGGRVWAEAAEDRGAVFWFTLGTPAIETQPAPEHPIAAPR